MDESVVSEDHRGVDTAQIARMLRMTPAERVAHMVTVANTLRAIRERAEQVPPQKL